MKKTKWTLLRVTAGALTELSRVEGIFFFKEIGRQLGNQHIFFKDDNNKKLISKISGNHESCAQD